jgi:hypothetical protein
MADRSEKHLHGTTYHAEALYQIEKQVQLVDLKIKIKMYSETFRTFFSTHRFVLN